MPGTCLKWEGMLKYCEDEHFFLASSASWFSILGTNINCSTCVSYSCSKEPTVEGTQTLFLPALTKERGYYFLQILAALLEFLSVEAHAAGVQMEILLAEKQLETLAGPCSIWQLCTPCTANTGSHQHPANCSAARPRSWWSFETTSTLSLCVCPGKKIPTFMLVQQRATPNFAWSWISVTVRIFFLLLGSYGLYIYLCVFHSVPKHHIFLQYRKSSLLPGTFHCLYRLHTVKWKNVLARNQFCYWWHNMSLTNFVANMYLTSTILLSGTNTPKYGMLSDHWTFLPSYYCDYTFLKLNLFSWDFLPCSVVVWTPASSSAWLKDCMHDHNIGPRDRNCLGLIFMYFVWLFKLFSWKHFLSFSAHAKWFKLLTYLTDSGRFSLLNAYKAFKTHC